MSYRSALVIFVVGAALIGCRSKLDVQTKAGAPVAGTAGQPPPPGDQPPVNPPNVDPPNVVPEQPGLTQTEIANALALRGGRRFFQSRETIVLEINKAVFDGADTWQLVNMDEADPDDDSKATMVMEGVVPEGLGLKEPDGFALVAAADDRMVIVMPPGSDARQKIRFGTNPLRIRTNNGNYTETEIVQKDFDVFGVAIASFANGQQVAVVEGGYQFQGSVDLVGPAVVDAPAPCPAGTATGTDCGKITLSHGFFSIINPR